LECSFWREKWAQGPGCFYVFFLTPPLQDLLIAVRFFDVELDDVEYTFIESVCIFVTNASPERRTVCEEIDDSGFKNGSKVIGVDSSA